MAQSMEFLVKLNTGAGDQYVFCVEKRNFPKSVLKSEGDQQLSALYNSLPKAVGAAVLPNTPGNLNPPDNSADWGAYAAKIQVT